MTQYGPFGGHLVKTLHVYIRRVLVAPLRGLCPSRLAQDGLYGDVPISLVHNRSRLEPIEYSSTGAG